MAESSREQQSKQPASTHSIPVLSSVLRDGRMVELFYDDGERTTRFGVWDGSKSELAESVATGSDEKLVPYSARNSLIRNHIVLFPSAATDYGSTQELITEVREYLHRYVDVSESFERLAGYYVLLTWVYDRF